MADRQKKMGRTEMQKIEYLKNKKSFVDEISIIGYTAINLESGRIN